MVQIYIRLSINKCLWYLNIAIDTYIISSVLSRINTVLEKSGGVDANKEELEMAQLIIRNAKFRINQSEFDMKKNHDSKIMKDQLKLKIDRAY